MRVHITLCAGILQEITSYIPRNFILNELNCNFYLFKQLRGLTIVILLLLLFNLEKNEKKLEKLEKNGKFRNLKIILM